MTGQTLREIGERGLLERIRKRIGAADGVLIGPGDDTAVLRTGARTLGTADMLAEGIHFDLAISSPADVGFKSLAVNASDIAAMGGRPSYALVTFGAPQDTALDAVDALFDGMLEAAAAFGVGLAGGDVSAAPSWMISVAMLGEPGPAGPLLRSGARPGDLLCVTGATGSAAAGLALLRRAPQDPSAAGVLEAFPSLALAHRRGQARIAAGDAAARAGATAMIDVSDGLARDAGHIAECSGLGLELRAASVPVAPGVAEAAEVLGDDPVQMALAGGEDYELALAVPAARVAALAEAMAPVPLTVVGELAGDDRVVVRDGRRLPIDALGWDHFT